MLPYVSPANRTLARTSSLSMCLQQRRPAQGLLNYELNHRKFEVTPLGQTRQRQLTRQATGPHEIPYRQGLCLREGGVRRLL